MSFDNLENWRYVLNGQPQRKFINLEHVLQMYYIFKSSITFDVLLFFKGSVMNKKLNFVKMSRKI